MNESFLALVPFLKRKRQYRHLLAILNYDLSTTTPENGLEEESDLLNYFASLSASINTEEEFLVALKKAREEEGLNSRQKEVVRHLCDEVSFFEKVDIETYKSWMGDLSKSSEMWRVAKNNNDYALYLPYWEKAIEASKAMAEVRRKSADQTLYDICLDQYERGLTSDALERIFTPLKEFLIASLPEVKRKQEEVPLPKIPYLNPDKQRHYGEDVLKLIGYDFSKGAMRESMHPFSDTLSENDARVTTKIIPEDFRSNLFSLIHEGGHAIEFQNFGREQYEDFSEGLASAAICETHSRFYENIIGRSKEFSKTLQKLAQKHFGAPFYFMSNEQFYRLIRNVEPGLIRTEADEFTYCLHIIIRYEIERDLINGALQAKDIPEVWKKKYRDYLGVEVASDSEGVLQDIHWSDGSFGYFPTYALGNMYGAMILGKMKEDIDFKGCLSKGDLSPIKEWFAKNDFPYDYLPADKWLFKVTGKEFDPHCYIEYLREKYL